MTAMTECPRRAREPPRSTRRPRLARLPRPAAGQEAARLPRPQRRRLHRQRPAMPRRAIGMGRTRHHRPGRITRAWSQAAYNIGIATGPSGLVVIDLDMPKPGEDRRRGGAAPGIGDGADVLAVLCEEAGEPFPWETFTVRTGRGGLHLYFTAPPGAALRNTAANRRPRVADRHPRPRRVRRRPRQRRGPARRRPAAMR